MIEYLRRSGSSAKPTSENKNAMATTIAAGQKTTLNCGQYEGAIHQSQRSSGLQISWSNGRHKMASTARIGYSATHEKAYGATNPAKSPPSMPPNASET